MTQIVLKNTLGHVVSSGSLKLRAGHAKLVDNEDADARVVAGYNGVESLSPGSDEANAALDRSRPVCERSGESDFGTELARARGRVNHIAVSAPLQIVVGDDAAPLGPPSGTVTTAADVDDPAHFQPNEATRPVEHGGELSDGNANTAADVHNAQHEGLVEATDAARELVKGMGGGGERHTSLAGANLSKLKEEAAKRDLPVSGTKAELEDRIREHDAEHGAPADDED